MDREGEARESGAAVACLYGRLGGALQRSGHGLTDHGIYRVIKCEVSTPS